MCVETVSEMCVETVLEVCVLKLCVQIQKKLKIRKKTTVKKKKTKHVGTCEVSVLGLRFFFVFCFESERLYCYPCVFGANFPTYAQVAN